MTTALNSVVNGFGVTCAVPPPESLSTVGDCDVVWSVRRGRGAVITACKLICELTPGNIVLPMG